MAKNAKPLRAGGVISGLTLVSRVFGLIRDIALAFIFGGSSSLDAFLVALRIPNFFRRLFAEGAFVQSFLPIVVELESKKEKEQLKIFIAHTLGFIFIVLSIICALGVIFSDSLTLLFAPGFSKDLQKFQLTSSMLQITFPYLLFITLTAYFMALQNSMNKFALPAVTPVILNLCLIYSVLVVSPQLDNPIIAAAWAVFIAGCLQLLIQIPAVYRCGLLQLPKFKITVHSSVRRLLKVMAPVLLSGSFVQVSLMIDMFLASFLVVGSITWLSFAERLIQLPIGVFGIAIVTVMMPQLSRLYNVSSARAINHFTAWGIRVSLIIALPAALGLFIMAKPLLATIYFHGSFSEQDVNNTVLALRAYAIGLPGFILIKILSSVFFARQDTKTPLKVTLVSVLIGIIASLSLVWSYKHTGLALATSVGASCNATILGILIYREKGIKLDYGSMLFLLRLCIALVALAAFLLFAVPYIQLRGDDWLAMGTTIRVANLAIIIPVAVIIYFACLRLCGVKWKHINIR